MNSCELTSGSVLVMWASPRVQNLRDCLTELGQLSAFAKFNMAAVRHIGFVWGSCGTTHECPFTVAISYKNS